MALNTRIKKLEESLSEDTTQDARALARFMVELKLILPEQMESAAASLAAQGMTMKKLFEQIDGATRGLPKRTSDYEEEKREDT